MFCAVRHQGLIDRDQKALEECRGFLQITLSCKSWVLYVAFSYGFFLLILATDCEVGFCD